MPRSLPVATRTACLVAALSVAPLAIGAQQPAPASPPPPDARRALAIAERRASDASARDGVVQALRDVAHDRMALLYENAPVVAGRANVAALLEAQPQLGLARVQWQTEHLEISRDSTVGVTWGVLTVGPAAGGAHRFGRYIAGWRREGGTWRLTAMVWIGVNRPDSTVVPAGLATGAPADGIPARAAGPADADRAFAARGKAAGAPAAFGEFASADAIGFGPSNLSVGPRAIRESFGPGASESEWVWGPVLADAAESGDLGWTIGEATITPKGAPEPGRSKYLTLWKREGTGWKFIADGGNSRPGK
jgi:hypothetical protein